MKLPFYRAVIGLCLAGGVPAGADAGALRNVRVDEDRIRKAGMLEVTVSELNEHEAMVLEWIATA